jgi:ATP-dependent RNA helicase DeaD
MGFIDDMEEIFKYTNPDKKTLLFSATMPRKIQELAHRYMEGYELIKAHKKQLTTNLTEQIYFEVKASDKFEALCRIIDIEDNFYGLVFCRTKKDVDSVLSHLINRGYGAEAIHGDITQSQRERTLNNFRKQKINTLIATDVAARGIDVNNLTHVINYSLPGDSEAYVHRIGRTGRAGNEGTAITFITPSEYKRLMFIQRKAKTDIKRSTVPKVEDIIKAKKIKIDDDILSMMGKNVNSDYYNWAKKLQENNHPTEILAAILNYCFEGDLNPKNYGELNESIKKRKSVDMEGKTRLFVAIGKKDRINPKKLVNLISKKVSIRPKEINDVQVLDNFSFVTVPFEKAEEIIKSFKKRGKRQLISHVKKSKS